MDHQAQPADHSVIPDFEVVVTVAGSRGYNDETEFNELMDEYDERLALKYPGKKILYVSGGAKGPDQMTINRCRRLGKTWVEFLPNWDELGKRAGYVRNTEMGDISTDLIVFWDGKSKGSKHMYEYGLSKGLSVMSVLVKLDEEREYGRKPKGL